MNNNFTFNYQKQLEEDEAKTKKEVVHKPYDQKDDSKEDKKAKKVASKRKYVAYVALFIALLIYSLLSSSSMYWSNPNTNNGTNQSGNNSNNEQKNNDTKEDNTINKDIFTELKNSNYTYSANIEITEGKKISNYVYSGIKEDSLTTIVKKDEKGKNEYTYKDDKYYLGETLVLEDDVYDVVNKQYIDLDYIKNYVDHAVLYSTTIYKDGKIVKVYHLYIKELIAGYKEDDYVEIEVIQDQNYLINVDYTNVVKLIDNKVSKYLVNLEYNIILDETASNEESNS